MILATWADAIPDWGVYLALSPFILAFLGVIWSLFLMLRGNNVHPSIEDNSSRLLLDTDSEMTEGPERLIEDNSRENKRKLATTSRVES